MKPKKLRTNLRRVFIVLILIWSKPDVYSLAIGSGLIILGQLIHFISAGYLVKQNKLITIGPYRFTRNPFYLGNFFYDLGLVLIAQNPWLGVIYLAIFYLIVIPKRIEKEELYLKTKFGSDYLTYCKVVPRFTPRLWPAKLNNFSQDTASGFAWKRIMYHREPWRVMHTFGLIIIFYLQYNIGYNFLKGSPQWPRLTSQPQNIALLIVLLFILIIPPIWEYGIRKSKKLSSVK